MGAVLAGMTLGASAQNSASGSVLAEIDIVPREGGLDIIGRAIALESGVVRGQMKIERHGAGGNVNTQQGREMALKAGEAADIARVGVSFQPGDQLEITVTLWRDDKAVAVATVSTPAN